MRLCVVSYCIISATDSGYFLLFSFGCCTYCFVSKVKGAGVQCACEITAVQLCLEVNLPLLQFNEIMYSLVLYAVLDGFFCCIM